MIILRSKIESKTTFEGSVSAETGYKFSMDSKIGGRVNTRFSLRPVDVVKHLWRDRWIVEVIDDPEARALIEGCFTGNLAWELGRP